MECIICFSGYNCIAAAYANMKKKVHLHFPSIHPLYPVTLAASCCGAGAYLQQSLGKQQSTPWTNCQSVADTHRTNNTLAQLRAF